MKANKDIVLEEGKYVVVLDEQENPTEVLRYGEVWMPHKDCVGNNLLRALCEEINSLREENNSLRNLFD